MKLSDFIGEATEYDKKEMLEERKPKSWLKSVSAFANGIGGALFFGVSNNEVLVGLDKASGIMEALDDKEYSGSLVSLLQNGTEVECSMAPLCRILTPIMLLPSAAIL